MYALLRLWLPWLNVIAGLWLIAAPFVLGLTAPIHVWTSVAVGIIVVVATIVAWYGRNVLGNSEWLWLIWADLVLGLGTIAMPFVLFFSVAQTIGYAIPGFVIVAVSFVYWVLNYRHRPVPGRP
jgi:hypothetical protein